MHQLARLKSSVPVLIMAFLAVCVLAESFLARLSVPQNPISFTTTPELRILDKLSYRVRSLLASLAFLKAEYYMHMDDPFGFVLRDKETGEVVKKTFLGVSARGNLEVIALLRLTTTLDPTFTRAHILLGEHLTKSKAHLKEGVFHLQQAILHNKKSARLYALYGKAGELLFDAQIWSPAARYLEKALPLYKRVRDPANVGTSDFEERIDRFRLRSYVAYLANCYFELRDWENCYKYWKTYGGFSESNRIHRWMLVWEKDPDTPFDPEKYPAEDKASRTERNRLDVPDLELEDEFEKIKQTKNLEVSPSDTFLKRLIGLSLLVLGMAGYVFLWKAY